MADEPENTPDAGPTPVNPPPTDTPPAPTPEPPSRPAPEQSKDDGGILQEILERVTGAPEAVANAIREQTPTPQAPPAPVADSTPTNSVAKVKGPSRFAKWWTGK